MTTYNVEIVVNGHDRASAPLGSVGGALGRIGEIAGGILAAGVFQRLADGIVNMGREALDATASWERLGMAMKSMTARELMHADSSLTLTEALKQAGVQAEETMRWLERLAIQSPFDAEGVATTYKQALTFGFTSDKAKQLTQTLIDMSAGMGLSGFQMERVSYALGQINSSDKLLMQDLRQLMNAGVPVNDVLAKMGMTMNDLADKEKNTTGVTQQFVDTFMQMMGSDFKGAAQQQAESWAGLTNSMSDIKKIGLREFFSGTFAVLQPMVADFVGKFSDPAFQASLREMGNRFAEFVKMGIDNLPKITRPFSLFFDMLTRGVSPLDALIRTMSALTGVNLDGLLSSLAGSSAFQNMQAALANIFLFIQQYGPGIQSTLQSIGEKLMAAFGPLAVQIITWLTEQFKRISEWFVQNGPLIQQYLTVIGNIWAWFAEKIAAAWQWIEPILSGLIGLVLNLVTYVMQIATGDWAGAWETIKRMVSEAGTAIKNAVTGFLNWIAGFFGTSLAGIKNTWSQNWEMFKSIVSKVWDNIKIIIDAKINSVKAAIQSKVAMFLALGRNLMDGLKNGIVAAGTAVINAIVGIINSAVAGVKSLLGIASPSKVYKGIGKNMMQGLADGIKQAASLPEVALNASMQPALAYAGMSAPGSGGSYSTTNTRQNTNFFGVVNNNYYGENDQGSALKKFR